MFNLTKTGFTDVGMGISREGFVIGKIALSPQEMQKKHTSTRALEAFIETS